MVCEGWVLSQTRPVHDVKLEWVGVEMLHDGIVWICGVGVIENCAKKVHSELRLQHSKLGHKAQTNAYRYRYGIRQLVA